MVSCGPGWYILLRFPRRIETTRSSPQCHRHRPGDTACYIEDLLPASDEEFGVAKVDREGLPMPSAEGPRACSLRKALNSEGAISG